MVVFKHLNVVLPGCVYWPYPERNFPGGTRQSGLSDIASCILSCIATAGCTAVDFTMTNECWFILREWNENALSMNTDVNHWREYQCEGRTCLFTVRYINVDMAGKEYQSGALYHTAGQGIINKTW